MDDDAQALAVGRAVLALLGALGIGLRAVIAVYTQDALPPGARSKGAYLERHRDRVRAGVAGWTRSGQVRGVTRDAWELDVAEQTGRPRRQRAAPPRAANDAAARDVSAELEAALGIRITRVRR